jgi:hypothetical protein
MPNQLHSVTKLDFQPGVALFPPSVVGVIIYLFFNEPMSPEQVQRSG